MELLNDFVDKDCWIDAWRYLNPDIKQYTWFRKHPLVGSRLDFFLVPKGNIDLVNDCQILPSHWSDHSPVLLEFQLCHSLRGRGYWKINNSHLTKAEYVQVVNEIIEKNPLSDPSMDWEVLKNGISNYTKDYSREQAKKILQETKLVEAKINTLQKKLAMINLASEKAIQLIEKVNKKLEPWKRQYEKLCLYRVQGQTLRSKVKWSEQAERNTKYFFGLEKTKSKAKSMMKLEIDGVLSTDPDKILETQEGFYKKLYTKDKKVKFTWQNKTNKKLDATQRVLMDSEITIGEIATAIKQMPSNKTPGPDGLSANFFKNVFLEIKEYFT